VAQRTQEIGIRMALGARASEVVGLVVRRGLTLTAIAVALGLAGAAALSQLLVTLLYGVRPLDLATFGAATAVLAMVSLLAAYLPARRASHLDPVIALAEK
jgi:ABC-type antimicrobial peptide transport system permease subunit